MPKSVKIEQQTFLVAVFRVIQKSMDCEEKQYIPNCTSNFKLFYLHHKYGSVSSFRIILVWEWLHDVSVSGLGGNSPSRPSPTDERLDLDHGQQSSQHYGQDYPYKDGLLQQQQDPMRAATDPFYKPNIQQQQQASQLQHGSQLVEFQSNQPFQQQAQYDSKTLQQQQYMRTQQHLPLDQQQQQQQQAVNLQQQQHFQQQQLLQQEQQLQLQQKNQHQLQQQQQQQQQHLHMLVQHQQQILMQQQRQKLEQGDGTLQHMHPDYHPVFTQNLTPQQQQMYQQHMQLQHHAQHLKKIRRSLPNSSSAMDPTMQQGQLQKVRIFTNTK